ncbi:MAG TPA: dihydrodipicolinate synthase family protein [Bryobacteraceae bacterium]|nr:dihydrodipicolinate synthase family protein [Bryobacteraceae bacterium]
MRNSSRAGEGAGGMRGMLAASVTPRRPGESGPDLGALLEIVDFLCRAGVDGTVLFGSTGEFPLFETEDRARAVSLAVKRSRCPTYANVSHSMLDGAIRLAEEAASAGAAGVLVMPPIYYRYDQETIREFMLRFLEAVGRWIPAYLYNIPAFTSAIEAPTAAELLTAGFSGIKDSSGSLEYVRTLLESPAARGKAILSGSELLCAQARPFGAAGTVSGIAACIPELLVALERAVAAADAASTESLLVRVREFLAWHEQFPVPMAIKEAAHIRRITPAEHAVPLGREKARAMEEFRAWFREWHKVVIRECGADCFSHR